MQRTLVKNTVKKIGEKITLKGWADTVRDHGKITFIDLRDRTGKIQCVGSALGNISVETVLEIEGKVVKRPDKLINQDLPTGEVEVQIDKLNVLSPAGELPLPVDNDGRDIDEKIRMKYRYLDLRRPRMAANIRTRAAVTQFVRNWLTEQEFVEIETPILTKTTPEGARDFLVPSRMQPGNFYALPQSPQQYKQLLMVAGFEKYFQIARCFRDEDPRADRAYGEFTQIDIEMSFTTQDDIMNMTEKMLTEMISKIFPNKHISQTPFPRIPHKEAIEMYGTDKPDLRKDKSDLNELAFAWTVDFPLFTEQSKDDYFHGSGSAKYAPSHHMFTAPHPDDVHLLDTNPSRVRGLQHDLVLNGYEVGGGSIRIHDSAIQEKVFELIGFTDEQKKQFAHMLEAFTFGVPPHGGIAPGLDRLMMAIGGEASVREVIAFPATAGGSAAVVNAPSAATKDQLKELKIQAAS